MKIQEIRQIAEHVDVLEFRDLVLLQMQLDEQRQVTGQTNISSLKINRNKLKYHKSRIRGKGEVRNVISVRSKLFHFFFC